MKLEAAKKAYNEILELMRKYKNICRFSIYDFEEKSKLHLFAIELNEVYGLNIDPEIISTFDWIKCNEHVTIAWFGERYNRTISWPDNNEQPNNELLVQIKFPTGPIIFSENRSCSEDYPQEFFRSFWQELLTFNPDYIDTRNKGLYWKIKNAKEIFNSFPEIFQKYHERNKVDMKLRRIQKMKDEIAKLENNKS